MPTRSLYVATSARSHGLLLLLASCALAPPSLAGQQSIQGSVLDGEARSPVEGAMVVLLEGEVQRSRVLTAADGSFRLSVPLPGRYALRIDRIGYESTLTDAFEVAAGATVERTVLTHVEPVTLAGIQVEGTRRCEVRPAEGLATGRVWEEARKALDAAAWTAEKELYRFGWMRYQRELGASGRRVLSEERSYRNHFIDQPFRSMNAAGLAREGYIRSAEDDVTIYYAPDAGVLLSGSFLDTHCFFLERKGQGGERLVGLRFEPVPGRELPDVEGVLWLEEEGARLLSMTYQYVDPSHRVAREEGSGELVFRGLPNGTWIVAEWKIRMPKLVELRDRYGEARRYQTEGYRDEGGMITLVARSDGSVVDVGEGLALLVGEVRDSLGRAAPGARVRIEGAGQEVTTDATGAFAFPGMLAGTWSVAASHPALEALGFQGTVHEVVLEAGREESVVMLLPSVRELAADRCRDARSEDTTILLGRVLDPLAEPVPGAEVRVLWTTVASTPTAVRTRLVRGSPTPTMDVQDSRTEEGIGTTADRRGVFTFCGVPRAAALRASAWSGEMGSRVADVALSQGSEVVSVELVLSRGEPFPDLPPAESVGPVAPEADWLASKGFGLRREGALLHQTGEEVRALGIDALAGLLSQVPRIEVRPGPGGTGEFLLRPGSGGPADAQGAPSCELAFYLNGSRLTRRMNRGDELSWDETLQQAFLAETLDRTPALHALAGVEVFAGEESPVGAETGCGAVLLWIHGARRNDDPAFSGRMRGRVVTVGGEPQAEVPVTLSPGAHAGLSDGSGTFHFGPLPAARYRVLVEVPGWGTWSTDVLVRAGGVSDVVVEVEGGGP